MAESPPLSWVTQVQGGAPRRTLRRCRLEVVAGVDRGLAMALDQPVLRIGAHPGNDLRLKDPTVSGHHCELSLEAGGVRLRDLGSRNGTRIAGCRVLEAVLEPGVRFHLGSAELVLHATGDEVQVAVSGRDSFGPLLGRSLAMRELYAQLERVAASDATLLITGETGTGKELVADAVIDAGPRSRGPRVVVDCGALAPGLVESELFGHEKGAFTGAAAARAGAFERAHGGTLFLDELGELPLELQPRLLRALEQREVQRVGGNARIPVDVRVIAATHRALEEECNQGRFRADLFFRVSILRIHVPALRERPEDIGLLAERFLSEANAAARLEPAVLRQLEAHRWAGNVRELRNAVERLAVGAPALEGARPAPAPARGPGEKVDLETPFRLQKERLVGEFERRYAQALRDFSGGNLAKAGRQAGMDRMAVVKLFARHGLTDDVSSP